MSPNRPIAGYEDVDVVNRSIGIPRSLFTDDGRELWVQSWGPNVEMDSGGQMVTIDIRAIVTVRDVSNCPEGCLEVWNDVRCDYSF